MTTNQQEMIDRLTALKPATMLDIVPVEVYADVIGTPYAWAPEQHAWYYAVAKLFKPRSILEIGVLHGQSLIAMLLGAGEDCHGTGWDSEGYETGSNGQAWRNIQSCGLIHRADLLTNDSQNETSILHKFDLHPLDLIHVDGAHWFDGAMHDLNLAKEATKLILFDDLNNTSTDCRAVADKFLADNKEIIKASYELPTQTGLLLMQLA